MLILHKVVLLKDGDHASSRVLQYHISRVFVGVRKCHDWTFPFSCYEGMEELCLRIVHFLIESTEFASMTLALTVSTEKVVVLK
jgi:hypothetical protein